MLKSLIPIQLLSNPLQMAKPSVETCFIQFFGPGWATENNGKRNLCLDARIDLAISCLVNKLPNAAFAMVFSSRSFDIVKNQ